MSHKGGAEKHEIYVTAFGSHISYDLFLQGQGGPMAPSVPSGPLDLLLLVVFLFSTYMYKCV